MRKKYFTSVAMQAVALLLIPSCTDTNIYHKTIEPNVPNKVALSGSICTDDPAQRQFPVKVMFIIDTSGWNSTPDPAQRQFALQEVVNRYVASPNYSFALIKFAGGTRQLTTGYTKNLAQLNVALGEATWYDPQVDACQNGGCRDWMAALSLANSVFSGDVMTSNPGTLSRTRYVFIMVEHGPPDPPASDPQEEKTRLLEVIKGFEDVGKKNGVAEVAFHGIQIDDPPGTCQGTPDPSNCNSATPCPSNCAGGETCQEPKRLCFEDHNVSCTATADCSQGCQLMRVCSNDVSRGCVRDNDCCPTYTCNDPAQTVNDSTADLLQAMTFQGKGMFMRLFTEGQLSFAALRFDTTESVFVKKTFMATNVNAKLMGGAIVADSDGDGLTDREEICYGEILNGTCKILADCTCVSDNWSQENPTGTDTDPTKADTDADGINDKLEMLFATLNLDPLRMDFPPACYGVEFPYGDRDADGLNDCEERLLGTDLSLFDTDRDGYPDFMEFLSGTNPLKPDNLTDSDMDGLNNGDELEQHLDPQSNDIAARAGESYRYKVTDEGLRVVPYTSQPQTASGIEVVDVSGRSGSGAGTLVYYPPGTLRQDGTPRTQPTIAWRDPRDGQPGVEVQITDSGEYLLYSACACVKDCPSACPPGEWCNINTGACAPDPCQRIMCITGETCDASSGLCKPDCSQIVCNLGQRCDPLLGKCLTDRCLNQRCPSGQSCDPEAGVCAASPCKGWSCASGLRLNESLKPPWITIKVDQTQLPQSGFWCDGSKDNAPCVTDGDCPVSGVCRIRENIVVGKANKNCISFKIKNITLVETLEVLEGFGPGLNNIFVYFSQTPLDNPRAYSLFKVALVQIRFFNGKKDPNWAEIPLGEGDFFPIEEK